MSTNLGFENTDSILIEERLFAPSKDVVENANITAYMKSKGFDNYEDFYKWSLSHRNEFWDDMAKELHWFEPWHTTFTWTQKPFFKWFDGGKINIVYNCLDQAYANSHTIQSRILLGGRRRSNTHYYIRRDVCHDQPAGERSTRFGCQER